MIARLTVRLPFLAVVPDDTAYPLGSYLDAGYEVIARPPGRTDLPLAAHVPDKITLDGQPAFIADGLTIDFRKDHFERSVDGPLDPPEEVVKRAIDTFLRHLRYVTRSHQVTTVPFPRSSWKIRYLDCCAEPGLANVETSRQLARRYLQLRVRAAALTLR